MTTSELAEKIGILATSIHQRVSRTGSYFGIHPQPLLNGRLIWPDDALEQLSATQRRRAPAVKEAEQSEQHQADLAPALKRKADRAAHIGASNRAARAAAKGGDHAS